MKPKPFIDTHYADNGEFSHYSLIDSMGNTLWEQPEQEFECTECDFGNMLPDGHATPIGTQNFECNICKHRESYP